MGTGGTQRESIGPKSLGATNLLQIGFHKIINIIFVPLMSPSHDQF